MKTIGVLSVLMVFVSGAHVVAAPGKGKTIRLSLQIHKTANDSKIYDVDVREKSAGIVKATVSDHGRTGSATFEGVTLGRYGTKEGTVSGSISWECASVQRL